MRIPKVIVKRFVTPDGHLRHFLEGDLVCIVNGWVTVELEGLGFHRFAIQDVFLVSEDDNKTSGSKCPILKEDQE